MPECVWQLLLNRAEQRYMGRYGLQLSAPLLTLLIYTCCQRSRFFFAAADSIRPKLPVVLVKRQNLYPVPEYACSPLMAFAMPLHVLKGVPVHFRAALRCVALVGSSQ